MTGAGLYHHNDKLIKLFTELLQYKYLSRLRFCKLAREVVRLEDENQSLWNAGLDEFYDVKTVQFKSAING